MSIFMVAEGEKAADVKYLGSDDHGAEDLSASSRVSSQLKRASTADGAEVAAEGDPVPSWGGDAVATDMVGLAGGSKGVFSSPYVRGIGVSARLKNLISSTS